MSIDKTMKDHMDAVRGVTGVSGLLNVAMATDVLKEQPPILDHGIITNGDANSLIANGYYALQPNTENAIKNVPNEDGRWYTLVTIAPAIDKTDQKFITQICFKDNTNPDIHFRMYLGNVGEWTAWTKLGGVINPVLSAFKRAVAPLMGGVAYVA